MLAMVVKAKRKSKVKLKPKPKKRGHRRRQPASTLDISRVTKEEWEEIKEGHDYMFPDIMEMYPPPDLKNVGGRPKKFETPETMWAAACEYFKWCNDNPWYKAEWKDKQLRRIPLGRPYTLAAFCLRVGSDEAYFRTFKNQLRKDDPDCERFKTVISAIEHVCRSQRFEGASVGIFNAHFMSYDLGMRRDENNAGGMGGGVTIVVDSLEQNKLLEEVLDQLKQIDEVAENNV